MRDLESGTGAGDGNDMQLSWGSGALFVGILGVLVLLGAGPRNQFMLVGC